MNPDSTDNPEKVSNVTEDECLGVKPKKRRRGKKKKFRSPGSFQPDEVKSEDCESSGQTANTEGKKRHKKVLIRPVDVPKAPLNSTQFIMDDHDECHLYFSFETPNPYQEGSTETTSEVTGNSTVEDAAFQDIDYEYHSMQDLDNSAYYLQDFEDSYFNMRYDELLRLSRPDLIAAYESMEARVNELEDKLFEHDPGSALEQLQHSLLQLQEQSVDLQTHNENLKSRIKLEEESRLRRISDENDHSHSEPSGSEQSCDDSNDSFDESEENDSFGPHLVDYTFGSQDSSIYLNGTNDFEHVAIEQSSEDSYNSGDEIENISQDTTKTQPHQDERHSPDSTVPDIATDSQDRTENLNKEQRREDERF